MTPELNTREDNAVTGLESEVGIDHLIGGTPGQAEWAERIKGSAKKEFARVAAALRAVGLKQSGQRRVDTEAILTILEEKRTEVMSRRDAGYFIREWQEINGQVRTIIGLDPRYQAIKAANRNSL